MLAVVELLPVFSEGGVGRRGKCSVEDEWDDLLLEMLELPNLNRPLSFCPNWEAEVLRERVPFGENVGLLDRDEEWFIVAWTVWTIVRRNEEGPTRRVCGCERREQWRSEDDGQGERRWSANYWS